MLKWVRKVAKGQGTHSKWLRYACRRHLADLKRIGRRDFPYSFDDERGLKFCDSFPVYFTHTKGSQFAGRPFELSDAQRFVVWSLFGWRELGEKIDAAGKPFHPRRYRVAYLNVARKWGKSTFAAALGLLMLYVGDPLEPQAEVYVAATKEAQAKITHSAAVSMIEANPWLKKQATLLKDGYAYKAIILKGQPHNQSVFRPIGSDSSKQDGLNPSCVILDELHEFREHQRGLREKLETGGGARVSPLQVIITTSGDDRSIIWQEVDDYACSVLEAAAIRGERIDDRLFAFIARLDEARPCDCGGEDSDCVHCGGSGEVPGDDPWSEEVWPKANPGIGVSPTWEYMRDQAKRAKHDKSFEGPYLRYHCNIRVRSKRKIIDPTQWANCKVDRLSKWGDAQAWGGIDLGWRRDLASIAAVLPTDDGRFEVRHLSFVPEKGAHKLDRPPWSMFVKEGVLVPTPDNVTDLQRIEETCLHWADKYGVLEWSLDPANALQLGQRLQEHGLTAFRFIQNPNNFNEPIRELVRSILTRNIAHNGDPLLAWAVSSLVTTEDHKGRLSPDKESAAEKIDPAVALLMAFGRSILSDEARRRDNFYESHGLEFV